jgi:hypothetical protein
VADGLPPRSLSAAYEARLDLLRARAGTAAQGALAAFLTHRSWDTLTADLAAVWAAAQVAGAQAGDLYVAGAVLAATGSLPPNPVPPAVGVTSAGTSVESVIDATPRIIEARMRAGATIADAYGASASYLAGHVTGEPHRLARVTVLDSVRRPGGPVAWMRVAEPGACRFCRMLATRGPVYRSQETAGQTSRGLRYHANCRCRIVPVSSATERGNLVRAGQAEWSRMLATGDIPRMARRLVDSDAMRARAAVIADPSVSWLAQLASYERSIPTLRARVAGGDLTAARPLEFQENRVAELRRLLSGREAA